jgi:hypothetical protein
MHNVKGCGCFDVFIADDDPYFPIPMGFGRDERMVVHGPTRPSSGSAYDHTMSLDLLEKRPTHFWTHMM